jgi:hypothetical protein
VPLRVVSSYWTFPFLLAASMPLGNSLRESALAGGVKDVGQLRNTIHGQSRRIAPVDLAPILLVSCDGVASRCHRPRNDTRGSHLS